FKTAFDDLDALEWAEIVGARGRYALVRHTHAPQSGTEVFISARSTAPRQDLMDVLATLGLSRSDIVWMHSDIGALVAPSTRRAVSVATGAPRSAATKKRVAGRRSGRRSRSRAAAKKK